MQNGTPSDPTKDALDSFHKESSSHGANGIVTNGIHHTTDNDNVSSPPYESEAQPFPIPTPFSPTRGRKRKISETRSPKPKKESPPWKRFSAEGPTSFTEDGKRRSGRRNAVPLELQPQGKRRQTRGEYSKYHDDKTNLPPVRNGEARLRGGKSQAGAKRTARPSTTSLTDFPPANGTLHYKAPKPRVDEKMDRNSSPSLQRRSIHNVTSQRTSRRQQMAIEDTRKTTDASPSISKRDTRLRNKQASYPTESPRIMLRLGPRVMPINNPQNLPPARKHNSLDDWLRHDNPLDGEEDRRLTEHEASQEAQARLQLIHASRPGGPLSKDTTLLEEIPQEEPFAGYAHHDYILQHVVDLRGRMRREAKEHAAIAKRLAFHAAAVVQAKMPKPSEELEKEARERSKEHMRSVLKQLKIHLDLASQKILELKKQEYLEREAAAGREHIRELVDRSENLLTARTSHHATINDEDESNEDPEDLLRSEQDSYDSDVPEEASEDEESENTQSSDEDDANPDAGLTIEELQAKYANLPDIEDEDSEPDDEERDLDATPDRQTPNTDLRTLLSDKITKDPLATTDQTEHLPDLEDVDEVMLDDEDEESDSSGTPSEDEGNDSSDGGSSVGNESGDDDPGGLGLLGFFSKKEVKHLHEDEDGKPEPHKPTLQSQHEEQQMSEASRSDTEPELNGGDSPASPHFKSAMESLQATPTKPEPNQTDDALPESHIDETNSKSEIVSADAPTGADLNNLLNYTHSNAEPQMEISHLIRGQLRPYQHAGFEWLAGMYANATNGILADEMGLGKTFQTIALLAHLATHHEIWGPHLVVVPTSVILNWEIEFKKFLPGFKVLSYYGTQDERKEKRKGWQNDDKWNVVITSYQLALHDQVVLKRRGWHYLVLDEAHNIKNHKSQRWQTLLSFRSEARLLLTGTPLQNNLAELWSLLFFLAPEQDEEGRTSFGDLTHFSKMFHRPVDQILENGRGALDMEGIEIVSKLHQVLRPHLLRRLKADVEKQMPKKYEHVTICRLSKRQRQLYDNYMGLAGTRESFASGHYMSIINCLMQLRKVCNHPDLFETRQIVTSFAMPRSAIADYEIKELLIRRRVSFDSDEGGSTTLFNLWNANTTSFAVNERRRLNAESRFTSLLRNTSGVEDSSLGSAVSLHSALAFTAKNQQQAQREAVKRERDLASQRNRLRPVYPDGLLNCVGLKDLPYICAQSVKSHMHTSDLFLNSSSVLRAIVHDLDTRSVGMEPLVERFCCTTPNVTAPGLARLALTDKGVNLIESPKPLMRRDPFHEARVRLSIAFPDKSLIQYDCGKLQQLDKLLRKLQSGGHRAVIFTQMTKVLDVLERFMNLHGHRYLRLDGSTKIEQRQIITERFNTDTRILAFISSSRSGGLGINLTGADTVIFYDLDWNPAMDKQCQDRCHRIGQTRDVHIYRFVSEGTIEANILRKSNQKRMLDDVVIQEGDFTTEYFNRLGADDNNEDAAAALDKVLGGGSTRMLQQAEDKEDQEAAREAQKEELQADDADFGEKPTERLSSSETPQSMITTDSQPLQPDSKRTVAGSEQAATNRSKFNPDHMDPAAREQLMDHFASKPLPQDKPEFRDVDEDGAPCPAGSDGYLIRLMGWEMRDVIWVPPRSGKDKKKKKKGSEFGIIRR